MSNTNPTISKFFVTNVDLKKDVFEIKDGDSPDVKQFPKNWNIRVDTKNTKSVRFILDDKNEGFEKVPPFVYSGDSNAINLPVGKHKLVATPFSNKDGKSGRGNAATIKFEIKIAKKPPVPTPVPPPKPDPKPPTPTPTPVPVPTPVPPPPPKPDPTPTPLPAGAVAVGSSRSVKDLTAMKDNTEYVLDPGTYDIKPMTVKGKLVIRSADPKNPAKINFPIVWDATLPVGPDLGPPQKSPTLIVIGQCIMQDVNTVGGEDIIVFESHPGCTLLAKNITMDGGGILRGAGGDDVQIINVQSTGKPRAYFVANFTNICKSLIIDLTGCLPVQQGGRFVGGQPQGETPIRFMDCDYVKITGVTTAPWLYDGKHIWKQDIQFRPDSKLLEAYNCHFYLPDIGDMTWRVPPHPVANVRFVNCILDNFPHITPGASVVEFANCTVKGATVTRTDNH